MKKFLMILSVFAFLATSMAGLAHAETLCDPSSEICASQHLDNNTDNSKPKDGCDLACSGCHAHCHNHISFQALSTLSSLFGEKEKNTLGQEIIYISDLVYGLKRPPKA